MNRSTLERLAPLTGLVFVGLILVTIFGFGNNEPDATDSTQKVVAYWHNHHDKEMFGALIGTVAVVSLVWFGGVVRAHLASAEGGAARLATTAFGGFVLIGVGGLLFSGIDFAAADTAGKVPAGVTQTLSVMNSDLYFPLAGGLAIAMLATGVASLRHKALPTWLGVLAILIGVIAVTPVGFFGFLALLVWSLVTSILLYRRGVGETA